MTSRPTPPAGDVPARRASYTTSCTAICVVGSVSRRSWSASLITRRLGMPPPHESHHLPAAVIVASLASMAGNALSGGSAQAELVALRVLHHHEVAVHHLLVRGAQPGRAGADQP